LNVLPVPQRNSTAKADTAQNACRALILVDSSAIRQELRKEYDRVLRAVEHARHELDRFEKQDKPEFSRWFYQRFGAVITQIRETHQLLATQRALLFEVEAEALINDSSFARAYERVVARQSEPEAEQEAEAPHKHEEPNSFSGDHARSFDGQAEGDWEGWISDTPPVKPASARIKELYRALVRRLHPDTRESMTEQDREWWHQAQSAYNDRDVERLEAILSLSEIREAGGTTRSSLSVLQRLVRQFKRTLRQLKRQITEHKRDPAWGFSKKPDLAAVGARMERILRRDLEDITAALHVVNAQLEVWAKQAERRKSRPVRRRPRSEPEFLF
jgi:hypothetical protein